MPALNHDRRNLARPKTARAVARRAKSIEQFGINLRDWIHELQQLTTRAQIRAAVLTRPPRLAGRIGQGDVADAFIAAQAEWLCRRAGLRPPTWTRDPSYILQEPWYASPLKELRTHLLLDTPNEFRNRNLFTTVEVRVGIRRGRPPVPAEQKRAKTRERQRRFRLKRQSEA
jgi:hypothetical protein